MRKWNKILTAVSLITCLIGLFADSALAASPPSSSDQHNNNGVPSAIAEIQQSIVSLQSSVTSVSYSLSNIPGVIPVINVTDPVYGAIPDDGIDDTLAIQAALDAARDEGGRIVYFPEGTYITSMDLTVYSNTKVLGNYAKISKIAVTNSNSVLVVGISQSNVVIEGMWLENNKNSGCIGIDLGGGSSRVQISNNKFTGKNAQAVNMNAIGIKHIQVTENDFEEVRFGVLTNAAAKDLMDLRVVNNQFINIYADAIELNHPGTAYVGATNIVIANNYIHVPKGFGTGTTSGFGIGVAGATHVAITGNVIENARYEAIHIEDEAKHISIVGNIINGVGDDPDSSYNAGIYVIDGDYISIIGNSVDRANDFGIQLEYSSGNQATNTVVSGNTVTRSGGGIRVAGAGSADVIVSENVVTGNTGHGFSISGTPQNLKLINNISRKNGGYGLNVALNFRGTNWYIAGNSLFDNTLGDIFVNSAVTVPVPIRDNIAFVTGAVYGNYTPWMDTFSLGKGAEGTLLISAARSSSSETVTAMFKVSWNGTSLTISPIMSTPSAITLSMPVMNGNKLQVQAKSIWNGSNIFFDVQFQGMILVK